MATQSQGVVTRIPMPQAMLPTSEATKLAAQMITAVMIHWFRWGLSRFHELTGLIARTKSPVCARMMNAPMIKNATGIEAMTPSGS